MSKYFVIGLLMAFFVSSQVFAGSRELDFRPTPWVTVYDMNNQYLEVAVESRNVSFIMPNDGVKIEVESKKLGETLSKSTFLIGPGSRDFTVILHDPTYREVWVKVVGTRGEISIPLEPNK